MTGGTSPVFRIRMTQLRENCNISRLVYVIKQESQFETEWKYLSTVCPSVCITLPSKL